MSGTVTRICVVQAGTGLTKGSTVGRIVLGGNLDMIWLGDERGYLSDWLTQAWVRASGRQVDLSQAPWLLGPIGSTKGIGIDYFDQLARAEKLELHKGGQLGLMQDFSALAAPDFSPAAIHPAVVDFYTHTSTYVLDVWAEWDGLFRPFGRLLALLFSRRLQQLNVPLAGLDTSHGISSPVLQLVDRRTGEVRQTAWVRKLLRTGNVLYVGSYSLTSMPGRPGLCVKVVFPLPNGNAIVIMRPVAHEDGSLSVVSSGNTFGDPGFYFTVRPGDGRVWARYVRTMRESIRVYPGEDATVRADHDFTLWGYRFLRLHYRLRRRTESKVAT